MENTGHYYVINHIVMFTGLTDRTVRSYIADGLLKGEKINGVWHFTAEQVEAFMSHPTVRASIQSKNNSLIYDFLIDDFKKDAQACIILDLPNTDRKTVMESFAYKINNGPYQNIEFSFNSMKNTPRVILKGKIRDIYELFEGYMKTENS